MTEEELNSKLSELGKIIRKNQRLAKPFVSAIREAKKKQKELKQEFNKAQREAKATAKITTREEWLATPEVQCSFVKNGRQCRRMFRGEGVCAKHRKPVCQDGDCTDAALTSERFCIRHHPDYEYRVVQMHRYGINKHQYSWRKKLTECEIL